MAEYISPELVDKQGANPGAAIPKSSYVDVIRICDIQSMPVFDASTATYKGTIVLKEGAYPTRMYTTASKAIISMTTTGEADSKGIQQSITTSYPGYNKEIAAFILNRLGDPSILIITNPTTGERLMAGDFGVPLYSNLTTTSDNEQNVNVFEWTSEMSTNIPLCFYEGDIPSAARVQVAADATSVDASQGSIFQLSDGTSSAASITTIENGTDGKVITLLGAGSTNASKIAASASILLRVGAEWIGSEGASLTLEAFDKGSDTIAWIELSRK